MQNGVSALEHMKDGRELALDFDSYVSTAEDAVEARWHAVGLSLTRQVYRPVARRSRVELSILNPSKGIVMAETAPSIYA